jgi:hypothetical protein
MMKNGHRGSAAAQETRNMPFQITQKKMSAVT